MQHSLVPRIGLLVFLLKRFLIKRVRGTGVPFGGISIQKRKGKRVDGIEWGFVCVRLRMLSLRISDGASMERCLALKRS